jgi:hypothetical protein
MFLKSVNRYCQILEKYANVPQFPHDMFQEIPHYETIQQSEDSSN